jgi:hypothetical protein
MANFDYDEQNDRWIINFPINEGDVIEKYNQKIDLWERYKVQRNSNGIWHLPNGEQFDKSWVVRHP